MKKIVKKKMKKCYSNELKNRKNELKIIQIINQNKLKIIKKIN